jgi:ABC-type nitrate/sulfonate/bicarbonate transport system substrate-binding protein
MKQMGFHLVAGKKTPFMNGPIVVTAASLKAHRGKWVRFVKAYMEATHYMTVNKSESMQVLRKIIQTDDKETLEHAYEEMRVRATVDLVPPEAAVENLVKMMTYVDKRAATVDRSKLGDYSIAKELAQSKTVPGKK